jgi:hypothetical protein
MSDSGSQKADAGLNEQMYLQSFATSLIQHPASSPKQKAPQG